MRKLNEAVVSPDVKQIIDCITLKDWQRAYNTKQSLLPSMMNKITDPKKKVGRAAALFLLGRMKGTELSKYLDTAIYNSFASDETRADRIYTGVRNYTNDYVWLPKMTDEEEDALYAKDFPEYDLSKIEDPDMVVTSLRDITYMEMLTLSPSFKTFEEEVGESNLKRDFIGIDDVDSFAREDFDYVRDQFNRRKERHIALKGARDAFGGQQVFTYLEIDEAVEATNADPELKEYFASSAKSSSFSRDSDHISPRPIMEIYEYAKNFAMWLEETYDVKVTPPRYFNSYHIDKEFKFVDDDSAWNAGALRKEPLFQHLLKVTRTGISFTSNGASKLWHDFTKDIAEALHLPFSAKEF